MPVEEIEAPIHVVVQRQLFESWFDNASFRFASALRNLLPSLAPPGESATSPWDAVRRRLAEATGEPRHRAAASLSGTQIAFFLNLHDLLELRPDGAPDPSEDELVLNAELLSEMELVGADDPVMESGTIDVDGPQENKMVQAQAVDDLAGALGISVV